MAISVVQTQSNSATSGTTVTITVTATTGGNTLIVTAGDSNSDTVSSVTLGAANLAQAVAAADPGGNIHAEIWYLDNISSGQTTVTVTFSGSVTHAAAVAYEVSGIGGGSLDKTSGNGQSGSSPVSWTSNSTGTLTQASEIAVGACFFGTLGSSITGPSSPWTNVRVPASGNSIESGYNIVSATTALAYTGTATGSGTVRTAAVIATFKASTGNHATGSFALGTLGWGGTVAVGRVASGSLGLGKLGYSGSAVSPQPVSCSGSFALGGLGYSGAASEGPYGSFGLQGLGYSGDGAVGRVCSGGLELGTLGWGGSAVSPQPVSCSGSFAVGTLGWGGTAVVGRVTSGSFALGKLGYSGTGTIGRVCSGSFALKKLGLQGSAIPRPLSIVIAAQDGTDDYGNAFPLGITAGAARAGPQVAMIPAANGPGSGAELEFPIADPPLSNTPNIAGVAHTSTLPHYAVMDVSGPALAAAGDQDWVQLALFSTGTSYGSAAMDFRYIDTSGSVTVMASMNDTGWTFYQPVDVTISLTVNGTDVGAMLNAIISALSGASTSNNGIANGGISGTSGGASAGTAHTHGPGSFSVTDGHHSHTLPTV